MPVKPFLLCALIVAVSGPGYGAMPAHAQTGPSSLSVCNQSIVSVILAVSYREAPGSSRWVAEGWRHVDVDTCVTLQVPSHDDFYLYASDADTVWGGETLICVDRAHGFRRVYTPGQACTDGVMFGFSKENMQGKTSDTINLTEDW